MKVLAPSGVLPASCCHVETRPPPYIFWWLRGLIAVAVFGGAWAMASTARAQLDRVPMSIVQPAGGFLVTDGLSVVRLDLLIGDRENAPSITQVKIAAQHGRVNRISVLSPRRVAFMYGAPRRNQALNEVLDIALTLENGDILSEAFSVTIPPPTPPSLALSATPPVIKAIESAPVSVLATAQGAGLTGLRIWSDPGTLESAQPVGQADRLSIDTRLIAPELPSDAPSYLTLLAAATSETGFFAEVSGVPVQASVQLKVQIPAGHQLEVSGVDAPPAPVVATTADPVTMTGIPLRYGQRLTAHAVRGRRRNPIPVVLPTGKVSSGLMVVLPNQAVADGGIGPTLLLAVPPSPFGGAPFWPDVTVEGASLVKVEQIGEKIQVMSLERPQEPTTLRVLLDGRLAREILFAAVPEPQVEVKTVDPQANERAAIQVRVTNGREGPPIDAPVPIIRVKGAEKPLEAARVAPGTYRVGFWASVIDTPTLSPVEVVVELPEAKKVAGADIVTTAAQISVVPQTKSVRPSDMISLPPDPGPEPKRMFIGVSAAGVAGTSLGSMRWVGGGATLNVRLPFWRQRFGARVGLEGLYGVQSGQVTFDEEASVDATTTVASLVLPVELEFVLMKSRRFELLLHGGMAVRLEQVGLEVQGDVTGAERQVRIGGRGGVEAGVSVGPGALLVGAAVTGIGVNLGAEATDIAVLEGSLMNIRGELGYRLGF